MEATDPRGMLARRSLIGFGNAGTQGGAIPAASSRVIFNTIGLAHSPPDRTFTPGHPGTWFDAWARLDWLIGADRAGNVTVYAWFNHTNPGSGATNIVVFNQPLVATPAAATLTTWGFYNVPWATAGHSRLFVPPNGFRIALQNTDPALTMNYEFQIYTAAGGAS